MPEISTAGQLPGGPSSGDYTIVIRAGVLYDCPTNLLGGGTITGVTAGAGLTGGGTSGTPTLSLASTVIPAATGALLGGSGSAGQASTITVSTGLTLNGGALSVRTATTGQTGMVQPDGTSIVINGGVISAVAGTGQTPHTVTTGNYTAQPTDGIIVVRKTSGAATTITLEASPTGGTVHRIKDGKGDAAANNITILPASGTIDGASSVVIDFNYGAITVEYNGTEWSIT